MLQIEVDNTTPYPALPTVETCTLPAYLVRESSSEYYVIESPHGTMVGRIGKSHGDHFVEMQISGTWGPGRYDMTAVPVPSSMNVGFKYLWNAAAHHQQAALIPRATHGGRSVVWNTPVEEKTPISYKLHWYGKTESSPMINCEVHQTIGYNSPIVDIVAIAGYSDRNHSDETATGEFDLKFSEPVSWDVAPYRDGLRRERQLVMRGKMLFTPGELHDPALNATPFWRGKINVRLAAKHWEGNFLIFSNLRGNEGTPVGSYLAQSAHPQDSGGRRAFGNQDTSVLTGPPSVIEKMLFDTDVEADRPQHYRNLDGSPFNLERPENLQYKQAFHNSTIDFRIPAHDNYGRPRTWLQHGDTSPHDYGHITLQMVAAAYVMTADPAKGQQLRDQAEVLMGGVDRGFGTKTDRYTGQPLVAACILHRVLNAEYKLRLERWIKAYASRLKRHVDIPSQRLWAGSVDHVYGNMVPNAPMNSAGAKQGYAPWQIARYLDGVSYLSEYQPSWISREVLNAAVRLAETVVVDGFKRSVDPQGEFHYQSYYAVAADPNGDSVNEGQMAYERGLAKGLGPVDGGYLWTCASAVQLCLDYGKAGEAQDRATELLALMKRKANHQHHYSWMSIFKTK